MFLQRKMSVLAILLTAVVGGGCGSGAATNPAVGPAEEALHVALDAWQRGQPAKSLQEKSIEITDPDWDAGYRLYGFLLSRTDAPAGANPRCTVSLSFQDGDGNPLDRQVVYEIATQDKIVIRRISASAPM